MELVIENIQRSKIVRLEVCHFYLMSPNVGK